MSSRSLGLCTAFAALGCGGLLDEPQGVRVAIDAPLRARVGEDFTVTVTVENTAAEAQTLTSLDVADAWLAGVAIIGSEPAFSSSMHVPVDETVSYQYDLSIPPGQSVEIRLRASALKSGDFSDDVDACINTDYNCLSWPIRTLVE